MKSLLNPVDRQEVVSRINALTSDHKPQWGTMHAGQMLAHCQKPMELALSNPKSPRVFLGRIIAPLLKNSVFGPKPFEKGSYTPPEFRVSDKEEFKINKDKLLALIERYPKEMPNVGLVHPFFGPLTIEQWSEGQYKHLDHHLTQFGV